MIYSDSASANRRFLAAWYQYFIASHLISKICRVARIKLVALIGDGLVADMFLEAAELREKLGSKPYSTLDMDSLITYAKETNQKQQLLLKRVAWCTQHLHITPLLHILIYSLLQRCAVQCSCIQGHALNNNIMHP